MGRDADGRTGVQRAAAADRDDASEDVPRLVPRSAGVAAVAPENDQPPIGQVADLYVIVLVAVAGREYDSSGLLGRVVLARRVVGDIEWRGPGAPPVEARTQQQAARPPDHLRPDDRDPAR